MKQNRKKILLIGIGILLAIGMIVGVSYAWWTHSVSQSGINTVQSTCLEIELTDENPITLSNAYPITDIEARLLTPYTFTITNKCNADVEYDVNLDIMETENRLNSQYIAIAFNESEKRLLNTLTEVETSYSGTDYTPVEGRYLTSGELGENESKTYTLKLWMDESVTINDDVMNKNFISKVVITAKQSHKVRIVDLINLGDYIEMTPTSTSYTIPSSLTGHSSDQTINPSELNLWRVIRENDNGTVDVVSEYVSSQKITFFGSDGYRKFVGSLNEIAKQYEVDGITSGSRYMGYNGQTEFIENSLSPETSGYQVTPSELGTKATTEIYGGGDTLWNVDVDLVKNVYNTLLASTKSGVASKYWHVGRYYGYYGATCLAWQIPVIDETEYSIWLSMYSKSAACGGYDGPGSSEAALRPILTLKAYEYIKSGDGSKGNPYKISINE